MMERTNVNPWSLAALLVTCTLLLTAGTATAGGDEVDGELTLSKNSDFSTSDTTFTPDDTLYVKATSSEMEYWDMEKARFEVEDFDKIRLDNHWDGTFTGSMDLSDADLDGDDSKKFEYRLRLQDDEENEYREKGEITIQKEPTTTEQSPYGGSPISIPGTVEAEDYDLGGQDVAYYDTDSGNNGGDYRSDDVDIQQTSDTDGGYNVGWIEQGEWLEYTVNVSESGTYDVSFRVASAKDGGALHVEMDGTDVTGTKTFSGTGDWQSWKTVTVQDVDLSAGTHVMRIAMDDSSFNLNWVKFDQVSSPTPTATATATATATPTATPTDDGLSKVKVVTSRFSVLDDPNHGRAEDGFYNPGDSDGGWNHDSDGPEDWGTDIWDGQSTRVDAYALVFDSKGGPRPGAKVEFQLKNPGGDVVHTETTTANRSGIARFTFNVNDANYYGNWKVEAQASTDADTEVGSTTFQYNFWGCAWCHGEEDMDDVPKWDNPSPYTEGYALHKYPQDDEMGAAIDQGRCDFCHTGYDGTVDPKSDDIDEDSGDETVYPNGIHDGKRECEDCHPGAESDGSSDSGWGDHDDEEGRTLPAVPNCFDCHPIKNGEVTTVDTLKSGGAKGKSIFSIDEDTGEPLTAHSLANAVPCTSCHNPAHNLTKPDPDPEFSNNFTESEQCTECHSPRTEHNDKVSCTTCHTGDAHRIKFLDGDGTMDRDRSNVVMCDDCHQSSRIDTVLARDGLNPPKIPSHLNHSDDPDAGELWNETENGYNGPWQPEENNLNACLYCHGNTKHSPEALGRIQNIVNSTNQLDQPISEDSKFCSSCHYPGNPKRSTMVGVFQDAGFEAPPDNTDEDWSDRFFDHTSILDDGYSDKVCKGCHGGLLSDNATTKEFVHNVQVGAGGPDCSACHDIGGVAPYTVDINATTHSIHKDLNTRPGDPGEASDPDDEIPDEVQKCWACHDTDGEPPEEGMGDRFRNPWTCPDCHTEDGDNYGRYDSAPTVSEHYKEGEDVQAATDEDTTVKSCLECHYKDEMIPSNEDPDHGTFDADDDGIKGGPENFYHYGQLPSDASTDSVTNCSYCHQDSDTPYKSAMDDNASYHSQMPDHSDRENGPECTECHGEANFHNATITKPETMYNSSFCSQGCHVDAGVFEDTEVHAQAGPNNNTLECWKCHTEPEAKHTDEKQIHGIRYIEQDGTYSDEHDESDAADCQTCHQDRVIDQVWNTSVPEIPTKLQHADRDISTPMGSRWNTTEDGHLGPWSPRENNVNGCNYCHGDIGTALHNDTALGHANTAYTGGPANTELGGDDASYWCGSCHYPENQYYEETMEDFDQAGLERPPKNVGPTAPYDHSMVLGSDARDGQCAATYCHGELLEQETTKEFVHKVNFPTWGPSEPN